METKKEIRIKGSPNHVAPLPPKKSSKLVISSSSRASSTSSGASTGASTGASPTQASGQSPGHATSALN
ncbi:hypothetical protein HKD37_10G027936 [Glycine soja]